MRSKSHFINLPYESPDPERTRFPFKFKEMGRLVIFLDGEGHSEVVLGFGL